TVRSTHEGRAKLSAETLVRRLKESLGPEFILGDATPAPLEKLQGQFRFHILLRSEEHTSELQSRFDLVCRLLLEKKKKNKIIDTVETLAKAWRLEHRQDCSRRACGWIHAWFVTPATRVNPSFEYALIQLSSAGIH